MKEKYLHYLWNSNSILFQNQKLVHGESFRIINKGTYNLGSGPDFLNACVEINDVIWHGSIEFHVKSSDWYHHNHQNDSAYDNTILHVVLENDKDVIQNNRLIPTLEIYELIEASHFKKFNDVEVIKNPIICSTHIKDVEKIYLELLKSNVLISRLNRKVEDYETNFFKNQVLYSLLAKSFGKKVNDEQMLSLSNFLPYKLLQKENFEKIDLLINGVSGFLEESDVNFKYYKQKYDLYRMKPYFWKKKGLRPNSFPEKQLNRFILFLNSRFIEKFSYENSVEEIINQVEHSCDSINYLKGKNSIIMNAIVPFLWWYGEKLRNENYKEKALRILEELPSEKNEIISKWRNTGIVIKKAYDSQALLEIYNEFCSKKQCLNCIIGKQILNR